MARIDIADWDHLSAAKVQFSDCGSFCFLTDFYGRIVTLKSNLLKENAAKLQIPALWGDETSYNRSFFHVDWREESTTVKLYQALDQGDSTRFPRSAQRRPRLEHTISVAITAIPAHLASGAVYLLVGKSADDLTRMLFLPEKGSPEIKYLRVTLNQILDELATRSAELQASLEPSGYTTEEDASDIGSEEDSVSADEDGLDSQLEESSDTRSQEATMSAEEDKLDSESEEGSDMG